MTTLEMRTQRATLVGQARVILKKSGDENRDLSPEESQEYDRIMADVDGLKVKIDRAERVEAAEADLESPVERRGAPVSRGGDGAQEAADAGRVRSAYRHWLRSGEVRQEFRAEQERLSREYRDTVISTDSKGGYLVAPVMITADVVRIVQDMVFIRQLCEAAGSVTTVTGAKKLGVRKMVTHMADADWTTEVAAVTEDTTMALDRRDLEPHILTKLAKVSEYTLELAADAETIVRDELAYKFGVTEEKAFTTGNGVGKPLGVFTASVDGISTARDVAASSATAFTADNLIDLKYSLKAAYRNDPSCAWIVSREFVKRARKLKVASTTGGNDQEYIWQPGLTGGQPDRILDIKYHESEFAPATYTTGLYVAVLGCFRYYRIAQVGAMLVKRLDELYAATNEVGFKGRRWVDGAPILEEAFARLKLA